MDSIRFFLISLFVFAALALGQEVNEQGRIQKSDSSTIVKKDSVKTVKSYNPSLALAASLVIPGAGQVYTGHYIKAGLFFVSEIGVGLFGYQRYLYTVALKKNADSITAIWKTLKDSVAIARSPIDSTKNDTTDVGFFWKLKADSARYEENDTRNVLFQSLAWMVGIYYYNVLDALQCAGVLRDSSKKNPTVAGWLAAIPGLGLGQIYNGELSKAGMILMTQLNLAYVAFNYHMSMVECEHAEASVDPNNKPEYSLFYGPQRDRWEYRRTNAFRNRNMFLWYSLAFYFYGILDAVVDAHLHDAPLKMKLEPDLTPQSKEIGLKATFAF
jgi:TM2 domain-containing membrane protein YozV